MKRAFIPCLVALLLTIVSHAQQFRWVRGGGTIYDFSLSGSIHDEQVKYMCTDHNGNIYMLSQVGNAAITADTFHSTPYGSTDNIVLTSYNCNGQMRWAKLIGSSGGNCIPYGIVADSLGHIYVAGNFPHNTGTFTLRIGHDTAISTDIYLSEGLIQFDTTGHFGWIRFVGDNSAATFSGVGGLHNPIALDGVNNLHYFCYVKAGVPLSASITSVNGVYDLTYNSTGSLLSVVELDLEPQFFLRGAVIDPENNKVYTYGEVNTAGPVDTFFAAAFDVTRHRIWQYFPGHGSSNALSGIVLDKTKHLHFSGGAHSSTFSFNGDSVSSTHFGGDMAVILTTDTNGNVEWFRFFECTLSVNGFSSITLLPNNKVAAIGTFAGQVLDEGGASFVTPAGMGALPYFAVVNADGDLLTMQHLKGDAGAGGMAAAADNVGNIYIGGYASDSIYAGLPAIPAYHTIGGNTDFFIMKYGVDCSCTSSPIASHTDTGTHTVGFTYTGTTTGIDSVVWNFGDGSTGTGIAPFHTYVASGTYHACAIVYTECGSDIHCSDVVVVVIPSGIQGSSQAGIQAYPNPIRDELHISGVPQNTNYRILNVTGECVAQGNLIAGSSVISAHALSAGVYILEMSGTDGLRNMVRIVKQ